ncbi:MAG: DNA-directed RNA polymerase subunit alpha [Bacteroidales bacterium]|nr:DNA-directed RNA polymerase subunit alpha [Bacteroidales bacterium]MDY5194620.1 DNA-directed RNA polymerase subunit alpha [Candidatus Aphodosoma sp.]
MAILAFQKPEKVIMVEADDKFGKFEFRPLEPGFGITIGNALRRILLSSLEGYAISSIKIDGVQHEFDVIPGVIDDVTNIILNLKQVRLKHIAGTADEDTIRINVNGKEELKAGDFNDCMSNFEVLNPELVICRMDSSASFNMTLNIIKGRGYLPADENELYGTEIGIIPIDAIFTPIRNVKYDPQPYRVEQKTDYENLILEITTDGSIHPKEALKEAASILIQHFALFSDDLITIPTAGSNSDDTFDESVLHMRQLLKTKLTELDLSVRALNCLKAADVETLGDLCSINRAELLKFRNFGKKSLTELDAKLASLNLTFGMDLTKYKLDKE